MALIMLMLVVTTVMAMGGKESSSPADKVVRTPAQAQKASREITVDMGNGDWDWGQRAIRYSINSEAPITLLVGGEKSVPRCKLTFTAHVGDKVQVIWSAGTNTRVAELFVYYSDTPAANINDTDKALGSLYGHQAIGGSGRFPDHELANNPVATFTVTARGTPNVKIAHSEVRPAPIVFSDETAPSGTPLTLVDGWYWVHAGPSTQFHDKIYVYYMENKGGGQFTLRNPDGSYWGIDDAEKDSVRLTNVKNPFLFWTSGFTKTPVVGRSGESGAYTALRPAGNRDFVAVSGYIIMWPLPANAATPANTAFYFSPRLTAPDNATWYTPPPVPAARGNTKTLTLGKFSVEITNVYAMGGHVDFTTPKAPGMTCNNFFIFVAPPATVRFINEEEMQLGVERTTGQYGKFGIYNSIYNVSPHEIPPPGPPPRAGETEPVWVPPPKPLYPSVEYDRFHGSGFSHQVPVTKGSVISIPENWELLIQAGNNTAVRGFPNGTLWTIYVICVDEKTAASFADKPGTSPRTSVGDGNGGSYVVYPIP